MDWNISLFNYLNSLAGLNPTGDFLVVLVGQYLPYLVGLLPLLIIRKLGRDKRAIISVGLIYFSALVARFVVTPVIRALVDSPRPFLTPGTHQLIFNETSSSFPSGHAVFLFGLAAGIWFYDRQLGYLTGALALLVGIARVMAGVHWPVDIVAGIMLGAATVGVTEWLRLKYENRRGGT